MLFIPFIYFTLLTVYWWKKHQGLDICVYMSGLYAITALVCIIVVRADMLNDAGVLFDESDLELGVVPTFLYCALLTLGMLPFSMLYKKDLKRIWTPNPKIPYCISWFLIAIAFLNLYLIADSTIEILSGDLSTVRADHYNGIESPAQIKAESLPFIVRFLYYFNNSTLLALPLFFYYLCFEKRSFWFKLLLFFASFSTPLAGIQSADRTEIVFYAMMFVSCIIIFLNHVSPKAKLTMRIVSIPIALAMLVYFITVSEARFGKSEEGTTTFLTQYVGQNYLNFCFFWEKANQDELGAEREFPLIYHYAFHIDNDSDRREERSGKQGFFISVFPSYIGDILLDLTIVGLLLWMIIFFLIGVLLMKRPHREELRLGEYVAYFALSVIPIFGVFYYRYMAFVYSFMLIIVVFLYITDRFDFILNSENNCEDEEKTEEIQ